MISPTCPFRVQKRKRKNKRLLLRYFGINGVFLLKKNRNVEK